MLVGKLRVMLMAAAGLAISGCASVPIPGGHFLGYKPYNGSTDSISQYEDGPVFYNQNLSKTDKVILDDITKHVTIVLRSEEFRNIISTQTLARGCDKPREISGSEVLADLGRVTGISVVSREVWGAEASADIFRKAFATDTNRFDNWDKRPDLRYRTIETFIHEMMHMIPERSLEDGQSVRYKYYDTGHGEENGCPDETLVSYAVGFAARDAYKAIFDS